MDRAGTRPPGRLRRSRKSPTETVRAKTFRLAVRGGRHSRRPALPRQADSPGRLYGDRVVLNRRLAPDQSTRHRDHGRATRGRRGVLLSPRRRRARRRTRGAGPDRRVVRLARGHARSLLVAGGSGSSPLMAMLRLARDEGVPDLARLVASVRTRATSIMPASAAGPRPQSCTRGETPPSFARPPGRLTVADLRESVLTRSDGLRVADCRVLWTTSRACSTGLGLSRPSVSGSSASAPRAEIRFPPRDRACWR